MKKLNHVEISDKCVREFKKAFPKFDVSTFTFGDGDREMPVHSLNTYEFISSLQ